MATEIKSDQRISRLAPLTEVLAHMESHVKPVAPESCEIAAARGSTLSEDVFVQQQLPARAIALRDGFAVDAEATRDASSYTPATLPVPAFLNAGEALPPGTNAILPPDTLTIRGTHAEITSSLTSGDGVLSKGADANPAIPLLQSGQILRDSAIAASSAAGISTVRVRAPRIALLRQRRENDDILDAALAWTCRAVAAAGGVALLDSGKDIESATRSQTADAIIAIGGTGAGHQDDAVLSLVRAGNVAFHGIAIAPGETAALGFAAEKPVLLIPGRLDAAFSCWLLLGTKMLALLSKRPLDEQGRICRLKRKVASSLGLTEMIPVSCNGEEAEPLASHYLPLQTLARADGWISVPAQSEGYPAGASVIVRSLP